MSDCDEKTKREEYKRRMLPPNKLGRPCGTPDFDGRPSTEINGVDRLLGKLIEVHGKPRFDIFESKPRSGD